MIGTYFQMRDELEFRLRGKNPGHVRSDGTVLHVFRVLAVYGIYNRKIPAHGQVSRKACDVGFLADMTMTSERTIYRALADLESAGWIKRHRRLGQPSDITLCWATDSLDSN